MLFPLSKLKTVGAGLAPLFVLVAASAQVQAQTQTELLSVARPKIVFPEMTAEQKKDLAGQAQVLLRDLYVHRYHKPKYYPRQEDPGVEIKKIVDKVDKMSVAELEIALSRLFCKQRDQHLNYGFPSPYANYASFIPLLFTRTEGRCNKFEVRVSTVGKTLLEKFAPGQRVPAVGDEVILYNKKPVALEAHQLLPFSQGANEYGGFACALQSMTVKFHQFTELPATDTVELTLKPLKADKGAQGEHYTITIPWLSQMLGKKKDGGGSPLRKKRWLAVNPYHQEYADFKRRNKLVPQSIYPQQPSNEPELTYGKIRNDKGHFGYLRLASFMPATGPDNALSEVRRLLLEELADTDALIFDVRDNGGGHVVLADSLPQLFARTDVNTFSFRLLNSDLNGRVYNETILGPLDPVFQALVNDAKGNGKKYTGTAHVTEEKTANLLGQVYFKPVAVLTNAKSYSATDLFSCSMQDNSGALIFGEDPKTGAGGATVWEQSLFCLLGPQDVFKRLPLDHYMRVAWFQAIRFGDHEGRLVEDYGCTADVNVGLTAQDLVSGGAQQLEKITAALASEIPARKASARAENNTQLTYSGSGSSYAVYVRNTPKVAVYIDGTLKKTFDVNAGESEVEVRFTFPADAPRNQVNTLSFVGLDGEDEALWNVKRQVAILDTKTVLGSEGLKVDFASAPSLAPLSVVNQGKTQAKDGWLLAKPYLQVGYNPSYVNDVNTDAVLFLDLRAMKSVKLEFGMEGSIEDGWDYLDVFVTNNQTGKLLFFATGTKKMARYSIDFSEFAGQDNVVVHFRFTSDITGTDLGLRITDIAVR